MKFKFIYISLILAIGALHPTKKSFASPAGIKTAEFRQKEPSALCFRENIGQIKDQYGHNRADLDFALASAGITVFIGKGKVHYQWFKYSSPKERPAFLNQKDDLAEPIQVETYRMEMNLLRANTAAQKVVDGKSSFYENHFNIEGSVTGHRAYGFQKVTYQNIYPNIDWVLYIKGNHVEYDFIIHPGGKVEDIRMQYEGAASLNINPNGSMTAKSPMGTLTEQKPYSFQADGKVIPTPFKLKGNELGFEAATYQGTLTIDPVLVWSSYYGGDGFWIEPITSNVCDRAGNIYYGGITLSSTNIATVGSFQNTLVGPSSNYYLSKFNRSGVREWSSYYGSVNVVNKPASLACDTLGHVYFSAMADSLGGNVTTIGAHQPRFGGGQYDFILAKFDTSGNRIWGTYYGGEGDEYAGATSHQIASDGRNVYLCGMTASSTGIVSAGSHQGAYAGGIYDNFLAKFDEKGHRQWATYYGGAGWEQHVSVTVELSGFVYLAGATTSKEGIATISSHQSVISHNSFSAASDSYLVKFDPDGKRQWSTYYGGIGSETSHGIVCDQKLNVYMFGNTDSDSSISTAGAHQINRSGGDDGYLVKFDKDGNRKWATYYGGPDREYMRNIAADNWSNICVSGFTKSTIGIASNNAYQTQNGGGDDGLFACFNEQGELKWGTYFGGIGYEEINDIVLDNNGSLYVCGITGSKGMATPGSHMDSFPGFPMVLLQGFMSRFCLSTPVEAIRIQGADTVCAYKTEQYKAATLQDVEEYTWELPAGWEGSHTGSNIQVTTGAESGVIKLQIKRCGELSEWAEFPVYVLPPNPAIVTVDGYILGTADTYASYQWLLNSLVIPGATARNYTVTQNGDYAVVTITAEGCPDTSAVYTVSNVSIDNVSLMESISIYPNPGSGSLLYISASVPVSVGLYSIDGRLLKYQSGGTILNIEAITPGMYLIRLSDIDGQILKTMKWTKW